MHKAQETMKVIGDPSQTQHQPKIMRGKIGAFRPLTGRVFGLSLKGKDKDIDCIKRRIYSLGGRIADIIGNDFPSGVNCLVVDQNTVSKEGFSRGANLLRLVVEPSDQVESLIKAAKKKGIKIMTKEQLLRCLKAHLCLKAKPKKSGDNKESDMQVSVRNIKGIALKIEDMTKQFRPSYTSMTKQKLPAILHVDEVADEICDRMQQDESLANYIKVMSPFARARHINERHKEYKRYVTQEQNKGFVPAIRKTEGYCECCTARYNDLRVHLKSLKHRRYAADRSHYAQVDALTDSFATVDMFLNELIGSCGVITACEASSDGEILEESKMEDSNNNNVDGEMCAASVGVGSDTVTALIPVDGPDNNGPQTDVNVARSKSSIKESEEYCGKGELDLVNELINLHLEAELENVIKESETYKNKNITNFTHWLKDATPKTSAEPVQRYSDSVIHPTNWNHVSQEEPSRSKVPNLRQISVRDPTLWTTLSHSETPIKSNVFGREVPSPDTVIAPTLMQDANGHLSTASKAGPTVIKAEPRDHDNVSTDVMKNEPVPDSEICSATCTLPSQQTLVSSNELTKENTETQIADDETDEGLPLSDLIVKAADSEEEEIDLTDIITKLDSANDECGSDMLVLDGDLDLGTDLIAGCRELKEDVGPEFSSLISSPAKGNRISGIINSLYVGQSGDYGEDSNLNSPDVVSQEDSGNIGTREKGANKTESASAFTQFQASTDDTLDYTLSSPYRNPDNTMGGRPFDSSSNNTLDYTLSPCHEKNPVAKFARALEFSGCEESPDSRQPGDGAENVSINVDAMADLILGSPCGSFLSKTGKESQARTEFVCPSGWAKWTQSGHQDSTMKAQKRPHTPEVGESSHPDVDNLKSARQLDSGCFVSKSLLDSYNAKHFTGVPKPFSESNDTIEGTDARPLPNVSDMMGNMDKVDFSSESTSNDCGNLATLYGDSGLSCLVSESSNTMDVFNKLISKSVFNEAFREEPDGRSSSSLSTGRGATNSSSDISGIPPGKVVRPQGRGKQITYKPRTPRPRIRGCLDLQASETSCDAPCYTPPRRKIKKVWISTPVSESKLRICRKPSIESSCSGDSDAQLLNSPIPKDQESFDKWSVRRSGNCKLIFSVDSKKYKRKLVRKGASKSKRVKLDFNNAD